MKNFDVEQIAIFGDWHGDLTFAVHALAAAHELRTPELYFHVGDFGFWPAAHEESSFNNYLSGIETLLAAQNKILLWIDGNHEDHSWLSTFPLDEDGLRPISEHIYHLPRGAAVTAGGKKIVGFGGAYSIDRKFRTKGYSWFEEEVITHSDLERALANGVADIVLSHEAPMIAPGRTTGSFDIDQLTADQRALVAQAFVELQAKLLVHGHHHRAYIGAYAGETVVGLGCNTDLDTITLKSLELNRVLVDLKEL